MCIIAIHRCILFAGPTSLNASASTNFGVGDGPIVANVACSGNEVQLMDCVFNIIHGCVHDDDVTLICTATGTGKDMDSNYSYNIILLYRSKKVW